MKQLGLFDQDIEGLARVDRRRDAEPEQDRTPRGGVSASVGQALDAVVRARPIPGPSEWPGLAGVLSEEPGTRTARRLSYEWHQRFEAFSWGLLTGCLLLGMAAIAWRAYSVWNDWA